MAHERSDETEMSPLNFQASGGSLARHTGARGASPGDSPPKVNALVTPYLRRPNNDFNILSRLLFPWVWMILFVIAVIIVVKVYEQKGVITPTQKNTYNLITTALIVFFSLSFYEAFKGLAKALRPHIVHWFKPAPSTLEEIQGFDNLLVVLNLIFSSISRGFWLFCVAWLLLNIIAQMAAALISLTYTIDDGNDYNGTYLSSGQVNVSNLTCYFHNGCQFAVTTDTLAHAYGDNTRGPDSTSYFDCGNYSDVASVISSKQDFPYYCRRNTTIQEFAYRFNEYHPSDTQKFYPHFTDRVITASSGKCNEYNETGFDKTRHIGDDSGDGVNFISSVRYNYTNNALNRNGSINIPTSALGNQGTTYVFRGPEAPLNATQYSCGDRCIWMWAYKNFGVGDPGRRFYACPVTVNAVTNVINPKHNITDDIARQAAASIALQGQFHAGAGPVDWTQWQWYAAGHQWETHGHDQSRVGANMAEHAIVSLAEMVKRNPSIQTPGRLPHLGSKLSVRWAYFEALMASIVAVDSLIIALSYLAIKMAPNIRE